MKLFLKIIFREWYNLLKNKNYRAFFRLALVYTTFNKRYRSMNLRVLGYRLLIADSLSFIWQFKEIFVDEFYCFESNTDRPIIYDCGSNIGLSCLYFKKIYPLARIKAFEADPKICDILKTNLSQNFIKGVEVFDKAVWINDATLFFESEGADGGSLINSQSNNRIEVQAIRLRTLLEKEEHVNMLKMDIEGAETAVIEDCRDLLDKIDNLFIEYHSYTSNEQELEKILMILRENNFRYYLQAANNRKIPLINTDKEKNMDFQANIFAYQRERKVNLERKTKPSKNKNTLELLDSVN